MTAAFIPEHRDELTAEWLSEALQRKVERCEIKQIGEGEGFLGDILRVRLEPSQAEQPDSVIAKLPKLTNRAMGELLGAYERESLFYEELAHLLPVRTPHLYFSEFDRDAMSERQEDLLRMADRVPGFLHGVMMALATRIAAGKKRRYVLLLEDVRDAASGDQLTGASRDQCALALMCMARLHAAFWGGKHLAGKFWLHPLDIDPRVRLQLFNRAKGVFGAEFADLLEQGLQKFVNRVSSDGLRMLDTVMQAPTTLLHCDMRLDNLFFSPKEVVFFDWQLVRRGPAAYDVAYFLSGAVTDEQSADELLAVYHDALTEAGVEDYTYADLKLDYRLALHQVLLNLGNVNSIDYGAGRGREMIHSWIQRLHWRLAACE